MSVEKNYGAEFYVWLLSTESVEKVGFSFHGKFVPEIEVCALGKRTFSTESTHCCLS
ncbi:hypothetical protein ALQ89_04414 [Pseudomonas amygdali pv. tabaci]|uniref:Uncharacterized protein n=1 Tax=Pseudomonas amygdali pv. tabaci TaxID=322 RepID=A0AAX1VZM5_PSEAJ|nr:hypothetical protein ALQ89_04414 [Pseudomonas amygdali pv. tabaci]